MRTLFRLFAILLVLPSLAGAAPRGRWLAVSYSGLMDPSVVVRTGETLGAALRSGGNRALLQPHMDAYSALLPFAVDLAAGLPESAFRPAVQRYPAGSPQPAWAAILRGGRIHIASDGKGRVRVFLTGEDPRVSLRRDYPIIRHCLAELLPPDGRPIHVEVFAYRNDYKRVELRLNLGAYSFEAASFPPDRAPLKLSGLEAFFRQNQDLEGAHYDSSRGLVLVGTGSPSSGPMRATLADFAVAYRAAVHAGDNEPFVSLDPHRDPTKATVSFGGFLEDTRIGSVVLEADKRFKTITTGFDPNTLEDVRMTVRNKLPSFLTSSERQAAEDIRNLTGKWVGVRLWFYPDSITVDTDSQRRYAVVTKPLFTADAERQRADFGSVADFRKQKRRTLPPGIRSSVDHMNRNYGVYAEVFPELRSLKSVARLMALASWLRKVDRSALDLDGLLAVQLPAVETAREVDQMMAVTSLPVPPVGFLPSEAFLRSHATTASLSPMLNRSVGEFFREPERFRHYLKTIGRSSGSDDAEALFERDRDKSVREWIRTRGALLAFFQLAANDGETGHATRAILSVCGGVDLGGEKFRIRSSPESPALKAFRAKVGGPGSEPGTSEGKRRREGRGASLPSPQPLPAFLDFPMPRAVPEPTVNRTVPAPGTGRPAARRSVAAPKRRHMELETQTVGPLGGRISGTFVEEGRVVFTRMPDSR